MKRIVIIILLGIAVLSSCTLLNGGRPDTDPQVRFSYTGAWYVRVGVGTVSQLQSGTVFTEKEAGDFTTFKGTTGYMSIPAGSWFYGYNVVMEDDSWYGYVYYLDAKVFEKNKKYTLTLIGYGTDPESGEILVTEDK